MTTPTIPPGPAPAREIVARLQGAGHQAFWAGGCVRDWLLARDPHDFDIATSARPEQVEALFPHTVPVGRQFGVVIVLVEGVQYQVATFRAEGRYEDGRRPSDVRFTDAIEDARRRDLTVNGLFYDPIRDELHDWVGGTADLDARIIRAIGDPTERFREDHLRLLRVPRFAAQLDFTIEPATLAAVRNHAHLIRGVSAERIRDELLRLFRPPHAARGLDLLRETGLLGEVLPEVAAFLHCEQSPEYHPEGNVYQHVRLMLSLLPPDASPLLPWAVLLHDVAKPVTATRDPVTGEIHFYEHEKVGADMARDILTRLRFPRRDTDEVVAAVLHHMQYLEAVRMRRATRRRMILRPTYALEIELHRLDCLGSNGRLETYECLRQEEAALAAEPAVIPPLVRGDDLLALGLASGPALGALLAEVRERQLEGELKTRDEALAWASEALRTRRAQGRAGGSDGSQTLPGTA
jgi:poly(A) polymerase